MKKQVENFKEFTKRLDEGSLLFEEIDGTYNWDIMGLFCDWNGRIGKTYPIDIVLKNKTDNQNSPYIEKLRTLTEFSDGHDLRIEDNEFKSIYGLENLRKLPNNLSFKNNPNLQTFQGLSSLRYVRYTINFYDGNPKLILLSLPIDIEIGGSKWDGIIYALGDKYSSWGGEKEFTNSTKILNQFKGLYDPNIYSKWDTLQIVKRVIEYGSDETRINVLDHITLLGGSGHVKGPVWEKHYNETTKPYVKMILKDTQPNLGS